MPISEDSGPLWMRRPGLAALAGVAALAVAGGALAGYWAGSRAGSPTSPPDLALRGELDVVLERLAALEHVQSMEALASALPGPGDLDPDSAAGAYPAAPPRSDTPAPAGDPRERFAGAGGARFIETLEALQNTQDPEKRRALARELIQSPVPPLRLEGYRALLEIDPEEGLAAIRQVVADAASNPRSQRLAAQAVSMLTDVSGRAVEEDLYAYTQSSALGVQRAAMRTLELRGDPEPIRTALATQRPALSSRDAGTRSRALREIGALRSPSAAAVIIPLLGDPDSGVRIQALDSLGRSGGGAPALAAVEPLLSDPVPAVRDTAVRTVQRLNRGPEDPDPDARGGFRPRR